jgi:hypothetical protein
MKMEGRRILDSGHSGRDIHPPGYPSPEYSARTAKGTFSIMTEKLVAFSVMIENVPFAVRAEYSGEGYPGG